MSIVAIRLRAAAGRNPTRARISPAYGRVGAGQPGGGLAAARPLHEPLHQTRDEDVQKLLSGLLQATPPIPLGLPRRRASVAAIAAAATAAGPDAPMEVLAQRVGGIDTPRHSPASLPTTAVAGSVEPLPTRGLAALPKRRQAR